MRNIERSNLFVWSDTIQIAKVIYFYHEYSIRFLTSTPFYLIKQLIIHSIEFFS